MDYLRALLITTIVLEVFWNVVLRLLDYIPGLNISLNWHIALSIIILLSSFCICALFGSIPTKRWLDELEVEEADNEILQTG